MKNKTCLLTDSSIFSVAILKRVNRALPSTPDQTVVSPTKWDVLIWVKTVELSPLVYG